MSPFPFTWIPIHRDWCIRHGGERSHPRFLGAGKWVAPSATVGASSGNLRSGERRGWETRAERRRRGEKRGQSLLERNRSAVGKTKAPLVPGGSPQLTPPAPYSALP